MAKKNEWNWMTDPDFKQVKCVKPLVHNPQFEGKHHCKHCAREQNELTEMKTNE
tara:strand:+ start:13871 stop:14032 length:162 start_codon:yes stop_codon:yes gene_type:complete